MNNILGLDVGDRRIGVAIAQKKMVAAYGIVDNTNLQEAINEIGKICRSNKIEEVVIGIPKSQDTFQADKIHSFALELTKSLNLPLNFVDETLTSKEAERIINVQKIDPKSMQYKEEIDKLSAKLILEQYLAGN